MQVYQKSWFFTLLPAIAFICLAGCCCKSHSEVNKLIAYMEGAELQIETAEQRSELRKALQDMLTLSPAELKQRRYATYQMVANQWTVIQMLERYYVPSKKAFLDPKTFDQEVLEPQARTIIQRHLIKLSN